ncbi:MAG: NAD(P)-dependent alcohol dehydrogenase [Isosphaeraceae bacterium]
MRAIRVYELGRVDGLRVDDLPEPTPGPGEVLVRVRATSLNYRDLLMVNGLYNPRLPLPFVPLSDGAGEVAGVGAGVTRFQSGDRVMAAFMPAWVAGRPTEAGAKSALGGGGAGMLAEYVVIPETGLVTIPEHLTFEEAATLPCAAVTAWHALVTEGNLRAGETVLVQGTGGVSIFALQFARMSGARVIATSSQDAKLDRVRALGAAETINYTTHPEWDRVALALTEGVGVDHVVEVGGAGTLGRSLRTVRMGGRISVIGVLSGGAGEVPLFPMLMKSVRLQGIFVGSVAMLAEMTRAIELHRMKPVIDRIYPFDQAAEALRRLQSGSHFGKIVVQV